MILIQGHMRVAAENITAFREAAAALVSATRAEPGCILYGFAEDVAEPGFFHITERWADETAMAAHNTQPHLATFMRSVPKLGVSGTRIARYDVTGEKVLLGA